MIIFIVAIICFIVYTSINGHDFFINHDETHERLVHNKSNGGVIRGFYRKLIEIVLVFTLIWICLRLIG
jgi:hypothetical protein